MQIQFHGQYKNNLWKIRCGKKFILGPNLLSTAMNDGSLEATVFMVNKFQSLSLKLQKQIFFYVYPKDQHQAQCHYETIFAKRLSYSKSFHIQWCAGAIRNKLGAFK